MGILIYILQSQKAVPKYVQAICGRDITKNIDIILISLFILDSNK